MRIVVLGGGFGGVATVRHLERSVGRRPDVEITLVSRENFFMITPLLFDACSGRLELRHCAQPIRAALRRARFIEATVEATDVDRQLVRAVAPEGETYTLPYDHLVVALGASTNDGLIFRLIERPDVQDDGRCAGIEKPPDRMLRTRGRSRGRSRAARVPDDGGDRRRTCRRRARR